MNDGSVGFRLLRADTNWAGMLQYHALALDPGSLPRLDNQQNVIAYGQKITEALCQHKAVNPDLTQFFGLPAQSPAILKFLITTTEGERYSWETLCDERLIFLAVHHACSVSRVTIGGRPEQDGDYASFEWPIRMLAFLSPSGVPSRAEMEAIVDTVALARQDGLDIRVGLYLGEQALLDDALACVNGGAWPGIEVFPMPSNAYGIEEALKSAQPQIVHFFCHGAVKAGVNLLEFASVNDHDIEAASGSVALSIERLELVMSTIGTVWTTMLNSCASAMSPAAERQAESAQVPKLFSMACRLAQTASPLTVGMAEPVTDQDATLFTRVFYTIALRFIREATSKLTPGNFATIDLGEAVFQARQKLHATANSASATNGSGRWWLPVLYSREHPLKVMLMEKNRADEARGEPMQLQDDEAAEPPMAERVKTQIDDIMKTRIDAVAHALRSLPANSPLPLRQDMLALLNNVPEHLRPDLFGNFNRAATH
ncbi:hypothetical protein ACFSHT_05615 [Paraburkholderia silviterrae]|uniref:CHAT domain-containing protein n=1 Tax=Paraburkholderia silviterrae TaxID=2528715 RepID=A0A4R5M4K2_9BURK|nr:hypothetical protein [Paraburkholderia silviterrae]TDG20628.1 hypothetical protein EYW47_26030 [Paraburkholderia silviterrae]